MVSDTTCCASMTLTDLLAAYTAANACSPRYRESLRRTTTKATGYGLELVCQLDADPVNRFLDHLPVSSTTRHNIRRELLTLWRWAYEERLTDAQPVRIKRIAARRQAPQAWSVRCLTTLLDAAERDERPVHAKSKRLRGVRRCDVLPAWIAVGYESGLRLTDMLALSQEHFREDCIATVANKTGKVTVRRLGNYALERVQWLLDHSPDGTVFRWALTRKGALRLWRTFLKEQGVSGSSKWLRRAGATELERLHPGMATHWLDHSNPALCKLHYIDPTLLNPPVGPPPLR